jgi:N-6 DNA Methylase
MSAAYPQPLPDPPPGFRYYRSELDIIRDEDLLAYQHLLLRAWREMNLSGVLTLDGIPTVYIRDEKHLLAPAEAAEVHRQFWNQGVATVLLLRDPKNVRVFSSMTAPADPSVADDAEIDQRLVEQINLATQASWAEKFYLQIGTGQYYAGERAAKFVPAEAVDAYLLNNLAAVRDELTKGHAPLPAPVAHSFLGRLFFTCYLCDRGIIKLKDYFPGKPWKNLHDLLTAHEDDDPRPDLYDKLFRKLKNEFNSSMFDEDLASECETIQPVHLQSIRQFLNGDEVHKGQRSLGFWAYDFKFIPVETISAIYENFLEKEGGPEKRKSGAYYTPRFLAEMTLDLALEGMRPLRGKRFLDPACGSGIFLVLLFNRLAAEWSAAQKSAPSPKDRAEALRNLLTSLRGVDKHLTACRIACFSLYLAFLDQFDPPDVRTYMATTGEKLPNLLRFRDMKRKTDISVVWERNFFDVASEWKGQFDVVIGNPPWAGRGSKQIAHKFMEVVPELLTDTGCACLLLPSKVFLNQTDAFQSRWLRRVTLDKVVQLADYSFILFKEAMCPCNIVRFTKHAPDIVTHEIEYVTPKVSRTDLRDGVIQVAPSDRKWIPLRLLLNSAEQKAATVVWKSHLWGTSRDLKLLDYLFTLPRLGDLAGTVKEMQRGKKRWAKGIGFQPLRSVSETRNPKPFPWPLTDRFVGAEVLEGLCFIPKELTVELGIHLKERGYLRNQARRTPDDCIFEPPLVLWNRGFTDAAFFDYTVRFQHALHCIAGRNEDSDYLLFLTAFLRSKLARYFVFHTAASLATERDQVHLLEALRLPFFLPDHEAARANASTIVSKVAIRIRRLKEEMEESAAALVKKCKKPKLGPLFGDVDESDADARSKWFRRQREKVGKLQEELNPLIYEYFGLNGQEITLIEDTYKIFDRSDTPTAEATQTIPTLQPLDKAPSLKGYAETLAKTLNSWGSGPLRVSAIGGVDTELGLALVELIQTKTVEPFKSRTVAKELATALQRLEEASTEQSDHLAYLRGMWNFDGSRIHLVKPALLGQWTRTAALNDAADLYAYIAASKEAKP